MNRLYELMKSYGVTSEELTEFTGVSKNTISRLRNEDFNCKIETLSRLAGFFRISIDELLNRKEQENV